MICVLLLAIAVPAYFWYRYDGFSQPKAAFYRLRIDLRQNDAQAVEADLMRLIDLHPQDAHAYLMLGILRHNQRQLDQAITHYSKAIDLDPQMVTAYNHRGEIYFIQCHYDHAMEDFKMAYLIEPTATAGLAVTNHAVGDVAEAVRLWQGLVDQDQRYLDVTWVQAKLHWSDALVEQASKVIEQF